MIRQLAFDLPAQTGLTRADFFVSPSNYRALAAVEGWRDWPLKKLVLIGPSGAGKTHLAQIWCALCNGTDISASSLAEADIPGLAQTAIAVENCTKLSAPAQEALFHLHNLLAERGLPLLMTADMPPRDWHLTLPDLASRVHAAGLVALDAPDDALLSAVLVKLFADRQISVPPNLIAYLLPRMDRSFDAAHALVALLDAEALARGRPVTRALAAELLDKA